MDGARNVRQAFDVRSDLEKRSGDVVLIEEFQYARSGFAGPVVEGEGDGLPISGATIHRGTEDGGCAAADCPRQEGSSATAGPSQAGLFGKVHEGQSLGVRRAGTAVEDMDYSTRV
jgi:hypothetical protein